MAPKSWNQRVGFCDNFGLHCDLKSSFEGASGNIRYSVTRETVIKALNREAYLHSEWVSAFLLSASHRVPNPNQVFFIPLLFRKPIKEDGGEFGEKGKSKNAKGKKSNTKKAKEEAKRQKEQAEKEKKKADRLRFLKVLKDLISYVPDIKPDSKKGKYKSVAFFVHGRELGEHYQVFHFSWTTNTFEVFDSACKATETADFGALGVTRWQIGEMCTRLKKKFDGGSKTCYATTNIGSRGHTVTNKATGEKLLGIYFRCSSNLELDPEMSASCGEASCMEALALLDPSLKEKPIWTDTHRHRAYVISEWISYIILPPQSAPAPMGMEGDVDFESKMRLLKQVMELDFGSSKEDIFKAVCKGY